MWNLCPALCQDLTKYILDKLKGKVRKGFHSVRQAACLTTPSEPTWQVILEPGKLKQEDYNFEVSLGIQQASVLFCLGFGFVVVVTAAVAKYLKKKICQYINGYSYLEL